jgi:hypothetical protein
MCFYKKLIIIILSVMSNLVVAQKIKVTNESKTISNYQLNGYQVSIELDFNDTQKKWIKQLKTYGKVEKNNGEFIVKPASVPGLSTAGSAVFSKSQKIGSLCQIWICIATLSDANSGTNLKSDELAKQILHNFAATAYRDNINEQIKDAEKALVVANNIYENEVKEAVKIKTQLNDNAGEKIELENKLKKNAENLESLKKNQEQNVLDQKKSSEEVEKMKRAVEIVKSKLNEIN